MAMSSESFAHPANVWINEGCEEGTFSIPSRGRVQTIVTLTGNPQESEDNPKKGEMPS